ncbi:MAG: hypothetical protein WBF79_15795 [Rhodococcus sp. (in: high G+C Gram-positive bacteria)]
MNFRDDLLLDRTALLAQGATDHDIAAALTHGHLVTLRRGVYANGPAYRELDRDDQQRLLIRAEVLICGDDAVVSHQSAALMHGLGLLHRTDTVHVSCSRTSGGHVSRTRHLHASGLEAVDTCYVGGLVCTSPARTVADLARALPFEDAVCVGDSALRLSVTTTDAIADAARRTSSRRGLPAAVRAVDFMDGRCESVGESRSRVYFHHYGIRPPELQVTLLLDDRLTRFRPDFLWDDERVLGEFDGLVKYTDGVGATASDIVVREKIREDLLREHGWTVVRWTWRDLASRRLADTLTRVLAERGAGRPRTVRIAG